MERCGGSSFVSGDGERIIAGLTGGGDENVSKQVSSGAVAMNVAGGKTVGRLDGRFGEADAVDEDLDGI